MADASASLLFPVSSTGSVDADWVSAQLQDTLGAGTTVVSAQVRGMTTQGGMSGSFNYLDIVLAKTALSEPASESASQQQQENVPKAVAAAENTAGEQQEREQETETLTLVIKTVPEKALGTSKTMGLWREANFYNELAGQLEEGLVPKVWFAKADPATGRKVLLMENLDHHIPAGVFFGPGNPNNWAIAGKLEEMAAKAGNPSAPEVAAAVFKLQASLHAKFWRSADTEKLLQCDWIQGAAWLRGDKKDAWHGQQAMIKGHYDNMLAKIEAGESPVEYGAHLLTYMKHSFAAVDWDTFQEQIHARPWTLCQGDCHPGNALWPGSGDSARGVTLIDFEAIALGSGAQDLGQFMISHATPEVRRSCEKQLVQQYYANLQEGLKARGLNEEAEKYTYEQCWAEYVAGGAGRWMFFIPLLTAMCPPKMNEFFRDQVTAFLDDHVADASTAGMPRV